MPEVLLVPDKGVAPNAGLVADAEAWRAGMANSKLRLFRDTGIQVTEATSKAQLEAAECDFAGYPAGGATIAAFLEPFIDSAGGAVCMAPLTQINYVTGAGAPDNMVAGFWIEDSTGKVRMISEFDSPIPVSSNDDSVPVIAGRRFKN